jgi:glycerol-3-phosphate cytidylyltransferase-like family protein
MIVKKSYKYVVMDTYTKEVVSEHSFESDHKSIREAYAQAVASNDDWKNSKK